MVIANRPFRVSPSSFIYPPVPPGVPVVVVSLCPGRHLYSLCPSRHLCPGVPVCDFSLSVPGVIYIRQDIVGHRSIDEFKQFFLVFLYFLPFLVFFFFCINAKAKVQTWSLSDLEPET